MVRACAVLARPDARGLKRLVAYVLPGDAPAAPALRETLRAFVHQRLPEYMVPAVVMLVERMPTTPSGKIDRTALPEPPAGESARAYVAPRTPTEIAVAAAFAEVLRVARVGATDDFYELGGHSLLAIRISGRLQQLLGVLVPMRLVFEHPAVAALAAAIDREGGAAPASTRITAVPRSAARRSRPGRDT